MTCAAYYGHTDVIKELIDNGADVNLVGGGAMCVGIGGWLVGCRHLGSGVLYGAVLYHCAVLCSKSCALCTTLLFIGSALELDFCDAHIYNA